MSNIKYENMEHAKNLHFIVPRLVKELYEHEGPKGEFIVPKKKQEPVGESIQEPIVESVQEPVVTQEPVVVKPVKKPVIKKKEPEYQLIEPEIIPEKEEPKIETVISEVKPEIIEEKKKKVSTRKNFLKRIK